MLLVFFFSSRRRHTRCSRDWSSDVCSSDLAQRTAVARTLKMLRNERGVSFRVVPPPHRTHDKGGTRLFSSGNGSISGTLRSEERRVGKECRSRWPAHR